MVTAYGHAGLHIYQRSPAIVRFFTCFQYDGEVSNYGTLKLDNVFEGSIGDLDSKVVLLIFALSIAIGELDQYSDKDTNSASRDVTVTLFRANHRDFWIRSPTL